MSIVLTVRTHKRRFQIEADAGCVEEWRAYPTRREIAAMALRRIPKSEWVGMWFTYHYE